MENALWKDVKKMSLPNFKQDGHGLAKFLAIPKGAGKVKKKTDIPLPAARPRIRKSTIRLVPNSLITDYVPEASQSVPVSPRTVIPQTEPPYENFHTASLLAVNKTEESEESEEADPASEYWQRYRSPGFSATERSAQKLGGYFDLRNDNSKIPVQISNDDGTEIESVPPPIPLKNPRRALNGKKSDSQSGNDQLDTTKLMIPTASRTDTRHKLQHSVSMSSFAESVDLWNSKYCPSQPLFSPPSTVALRPSLNDSFDTVSLIIDNYRSNHAATPAPNVDPWSRSAKVESEQDQELDLEKIEQEWESAMQYARLHQQVSKQSENVTVAPKEFPSRIEKRRSSEPKEQIRELGQSVQAVEHNVVHKPVIKSCDIDTKSEAIERRNFEPSIQSAEPLVRRSILPSSGLSDCSSIEMALFAANKAMEFLLTTPSEPELDIHPLYLSESCKHDYSRNKDRPQSSRQSSLRTPPKSPRQKSLKSPPCSPRQKSLESPLRSPPQSPRQRQAEIQLQHPLERPSRSPPQSHFTGSLRTRRLSPLDKGKSKAADMSEVSTSITETHNSRPPLSRAPDSDAITMVTSWPVPDLVGNVCDRRQYYRRPDIVRARCVSNMYTKTDNLYDMLNGIEKRGESSTAANTHPLLRRSLESARQKKVDQASKIPTRRPTHHRTSLESPRQPQMDRISTTPAGRHIQPLTVARAITNQGPAVDRITSNRTRRPQLMRGGMNGRQGYPETQSRFSVWGDDEQSSKSSEKKRKSRWKFAAAVRAMP